MPKGRKVEKEYYLNEKTQANGKREMHASGCSRLDSDAEFVGSFYNSGAALAIAGIQAGSVKVNGCAVCCKGFHTPDK